MPHYPTYDIPNAALPQCRMPHFYDIQYTKWNCVAASLCHCPLYFRGWNLILDLGIRYHRHTDVPTYRRTIWDFAFPVLKRLTLTLYIIYIIIYIIYNINIYNFLPHHSPCDFANGTPVRRYVGTPCICPVSCKPLFYSFQPIAEEFLVGRWDNNFKMWTLSISLLTPFLNFSRNNFSNSTILQKFLLPLYSKNLTARE